MKSKYTLQRTASSFCPDCHEQLYLLSQENMHNSFYICFSCKRIGEVGGGVVCHETF
jgi:uncharacterized protein with PIN domain